jgi:SH3-like domain-containing protein
VPLISSRALPITNNKRAAFAAVLALALGLIVMLVLFSGQSANAQDRKMPYWASIRDVPARMRKGPSTDVPVLWEYRRKDLPVKVVAVYQNWRKIVDPDGAEGWMNVRLLSPQRTAIVLGSVRPLRQAPNTSASILWRAEAGVVGRLSDCADGWCVIDVKGQRGYIQADHIWGA